jgi:peptide deformylase
LIREIVLMGDPVLRTPGQNVEVFDKDLRDLVRDMYQTMYHAEGIGLAAPQVGVSKRVLVVDLRNEEEPDARVALINPKVVWESDDWAKESEGCLSIPGLEDLVERPWAVRIEGRDPQGEEVTVEADDLYARALQHEIDHLNGVLFLDHVSALKRRILLKKWKKLQAEAAES